MFYKEEIKSMLTSQGACAVGVVRARVFEELRKSLKNRGRIELCEQDIEKRINPFLLMENAKSIIVCLFSYFTQDDKEVIPKLSDYAKGIDYHIVIKDKLKCVCDVLENNGVKASCYIDNSPLVERYLAHLAGLGVIGKNSMLINEEYGSFVFIGYILCDYEFEEDKPLENSVCIGCNKCVNACKSNAIGNDFSFNEKMCVSYLTQKKGELSFEEEEIIKKSGYFWGCDICQKVCPYNYAPKMSKNSNITDDLITKAQISALSNKEFKRKYGNRAFSWRGKAVLERNLNLFE